MTDLARFLAQGRDKGHLDGFNPEFTSALANMFAGMPPEMQSEVQINSGYRSPERQGQLFQQALQKYGSEQAARKWVAPPGKSQHNHGMAADLKYLSPAAMQWAHQNATKFGLAFPLKHENWHVELASARGGKPAMPQAPMAVAAGPAMPAADPFRNDILPQPRPSFGSALAGAFTMMPQQQEEAENAEAIRRQKREALLSVMV